MVENLPPPMSLTVPRAARWWGQRPAAGAAAWPREQLLWATAPTSRAVFTIQVPAATSGMGHSVGFHTTAGPLGCVISTRKEIGVC